MNKNLEDYIQVYNILDKNICNQTINDLSNVSFEKHTYTNAETNEKFSKVGDAECEITYKTVIQNNYFMSSIFEALRNYVYNLEMEHFDGWTGYSPIRWNKYSTGTEMATHCDHINSLFPGSPRGIPILSIIGVLNDDYKGGELQFFYDHIVNTKQGDIIIFPSNFLYPHKVGSITEGTRWSLVSWAW